jgi:sucrose phosphorylase
VEKGGKDAHKEINRTNLSLESIEKALQKKVVKKQLELLRLRNNSKAFQGELTVEPTEDSTLNMCWSTPSESVQLIADLRSLEGEIFHTTEKGGSIPVVVVA